MPSEQNNSNLSHVGQNCNSSASMIEGHVHLSEKRCYVTSNQNPRVSTRLRCGDFFLVKLHLVLYLYAKIQLGPPNVQLKPKKLGLYINHNNTQLPKYCD